MQPECFDEHCAGNLLGDQGASGLGITHLAQQAVYCSAKRLPLCLALEQNYRGQSVQQKARVAFQSEVTAENKEVLAWSQRQDPVVSLLLRERLPCCQRLRRSAAKTERPTSRKEKAASCLQPDGLSNIVNGKPAFSADNAVALDHPVGREADSPIAVGA